MQTNAKLLYLACNALPTEIVQATSVNQFKNKTGCRKNFSMSEEYQMTSQPANTNKLGFLTWQYSSSLGRIGLALV